MPKYLALMGSRSQSPAVAVILVEDEVLIRMAVLEFFADAGFEVLEAEDVRGALTLLETEAANLHVLFTDIHMPGELTGVHLVHHARKHWPWLGLLVASARPRPLEGDLPEGCRFIAKPYDFDHVVQHVRELAKAA